MPGCQVAYTVIARDGQVLAANEMPVNPRAAGSSGQTHLPLSIEMTPAQPHTIQARARSCENCHTHPKTVGLGINNGFPPMADSALDWSQVVTRAGKQLATVGSHWPLSRAFNQTELDQILRAGLCMGCHGQMDDPRIWQKFLTTGTLDTRAHNQLMEKMVRQFQP
jgi:hypothetical protein